MATVLQILILPDENSKVTPMERARLTSDLNDCFKTYDLLGAWRQAEEVIRKTIVKPFVRQVRKPFRLIYSLANLKQTVFSGALAVPHSPIVPRTPFPQALFSPTTPATPFTPFPRNPMSPAGESGPASKFTLTLMEDAEDPLAKLFNKLLRFVERDLALLFEISERVSAKHKRTLLPTLPGEEVDAVVEPDENRFEILANVVFDEVGRSLADELGSTLFAAGRPDSFRNVREGRYQASAVD